MAGRMLMGILSAKKVIDKENGSGLQHLLVVSLAWQVVFSFQLERRDGDVVDELVQPESKLLW